MNRDKRHIARIMFQNKVLAARGQAYEDLFIKIMMSSDPDFRGVKPQGQLGDRKNDGFNKKTGEYYQVYAPEDFRHSTKKSNLTG